MWTPGSTDGLLTWALDYASRGWPVFPCIPNGKPPILENGFKDASLDLDVITDWWLSYPTANVGIATGSPGPDVLDIDVHGVNGFDHLLALRNRGFLEGAMRAVVTPSGGAHFYYPGTTQRCRTMAKFGIDLRAAGGYVVAPPSVIDGKQYDLKDVNTVGLKPLNFERIHQFLMPPVRVARTTGETPADAGALVTYVERLVEGERNTGLFWAACVAIDEGSDLQPLRAAAQSIGLDDREIDTVFNSARRRRGRG